MPPTLKPQDWMTRPASLAVLAALQADGTQVRFVGGCVRDGLVERPVKDIDIATPDRPEKVMEKLQAAGLKAVPTGMAHGTVTAIALGEPFEVTTLRQDVACDGRHAQVAFTDDWQADAARRDLTINAMSCAPDGTLFDYFGGHDDLRKGRVRFVGDPVTRIREDRLRLLRFFRFHAYYGRGAMDGPALQAATDLAPELVHLSMERVRDEVLRLLTAPDPIQVLDLIARRQILTAVLPPFAPMQRIQGLVALNRELAVDSDALLRLAALFPPRDYAAIGAKLKLSNAQKARLRYLAHGEAPLPADLTESLYRLGEAPVRDRWLLQWADTAEPTTHQKAIEAGLAQIRNWRPKDLPVTGDDVMARGVPPGPRVGALLRELEDWWLAGRFTADRDACLAQLDRLLAQNRGS